MNVGQILETHLGWACAGLGRQIGDMLDKVKRDGKYEPLRRQLKHIYANDERLAQIEEDGLMELAENLRAGVPIATPVFDGAKEADIVEMLDAGGPVAFGSGHAVSTAAPAKSFTRPGHRRLHLYAEAATIWWTTRSTRVRSVLTSSSPSSRWAARRSSADSASAKWKSGRSKPTAPPTRCRKS